MFLKPNDIRASVVVFLVALPLCLGVALASNAPLSSGILAGIVGGIILGIMGGSSVSVSGPAAGLTVIVSGAIAELGGFPQFGTAVVISGIIQIAMGFLKAGELGNFFPSSVIKGMLAAIGLILIMKQLPHLVGWDKDYMGDMGFDQADGHNTFSEIFYAFEGLHIGAAIIGFLSIVIIVGWDKILAKKFKKLSLIPSALIAVVE
jgi:MFS superfamily sulfate permease-like transporter